MIHWNLDPIFEEGDQHVIPITGLMASCFMRNQYVGSVIVWQIQFLLNEL
jgi:hypothetical protein